VSTSLFVARGRPMDVRDVIAAVGEARLGLADGDLSELEGPWPDGRLLLYVSNDSARGVEVTSTESMTSLLSRTLLLPSRMNGRARTWIRA